MYSLSVKTLIVLIVFTYFPPLDTWEIHKYLILDIKFSVRSQITNDVLTFKPGNFSVTHILYRLTLYHLSSLNFNYIWQTSVLELFCVLLMT